MSRMNSLISFFRDCLREERSRAGIENLFAGKVLNRAFVKGVEEATRDEYTAVSLPASVKTTFIQRAQLLSRDTDFLYVSLPITGEVNGKKVSCPLLLYPLKISFDDLFLSLDQVRINPAIFTTFEIPTSAESDLLDLIPDGVLGPVTPVLLGKELKGYLPKLDLSGLDEFPILATSGEVKKGSERKELVFHSASSVILAERSKNVAGLLQELEILTTVDPEKMPETMRAFLDPDHVAAKVPGTEGKPEFIPALLSDSQLSLIDAVNSSTLTACQGPPGTGKSFSIAAAATEQILSGKSVLICCRTNEAADVLQTKLSAMVPSSQLIVRAGRKQHLKQLRRKVTQLMSGKVSIPSERKHDLLERQIKETVEQIYRQEKWLQDEMEEAVATGEWFRSPPESWWIQLRKWIHLKRLNQSPLLAEVAGTFHELHEKRFQKAREFHRSFHQKNLADALATGKVRQALRAYQKALGHRYASDQEKALHAIDPTHLLKVFPIWITTTDDLHRVLPLKPELFDLAVMDEATQCDLPSALPVLYRARRALITGDPKQLRHVSFLSNVRHKQLAELHRLSPTDQEIFHYRKVSAIDRALDETLGTASRVLLNEHYRSLPDLIRFSNEHFYQNQLHLMREPEVFDHREEVLRFVKVEGVRDEAGVNEPEIDAALEICQTIAESDSQSSLGFLSPFRAQVDAFSWALRSKLSPDVVSLLLNRNKLIAGTGHSFQGDERDGMILSLGVTNDCATGVRRFVEREDVFNVAVTRGRQWMVVCHSLKVGKLPAGSLLRSYLQQVTGQAAIGRAGEPSLGDFLTTLEELGWRPVPQTSLAGVPVDVLLRKGKQLLAVDFVGTEGEEGDAIPLGKALVLRRSGVPLVPIRIDEWIHRKEKVLELISEFSPKAERI